MAVTLQERVRQLNAARPQIERRITHACRLATIRAVEKASELTPPNEDSPLSGTHTRTGGMKMSWITSSSSRPVKKGDRYETVLGNDMEYASCVNDGHRVDRHFVPGLYINEVSGLLEFDPEMAAKKEGGLMVGTKTAKVEGIFMVEAAQEEYKCVLQQELEDIGEILE